MIRVSMAMYLQSHGFEQMVTFHSLKKVGLLKEQETTTQSKVTAGVAALTRTSAFKTLRKRLNLVSDNIMHISDLKR
ncbi:hypothetical protein DPMN_110042 [Dreissena polymorpha]|uniref:Uncharacterized protein n=1 Tax=Dreissena polymorpha TaxID=45954 RepID=A0A9D4QMK2_DREPO|nr:hypothetical protein DPMN_110042 [Dreissena polymorpha]